MENPTASNNQVLVQANRCSSEQVKDISGIHVCDENFARGPITEGQRFTAHFLRRDAGFDAATWFAHNSRMSSGEITHVSDTALMVAACRAHETELQDAWVRDPFAARLAG